MNRKYYLGFILATGLALVTVSLYYHFTTESNAGSRSYLSITGYTQGTTYSIIYDDSLGRNFQTSINKLLKDFDAELSPWVDTSTISAFNRQQNILLNGPYFYPVIHRSKEIFEESNGAFDPTIAPLVNAYGFGPEGRRKVPSKNRVDSLLQVVDFGLIQFDSLEVRASKPGVQLDFNAIAQGYAVDVLASFLKDKGIENLYVEIGGEVYAEGLNPKGIAWQVGILKPSEDPQAQRDIPMIISISGKAVVTSGNYQAFYEEDGIKYAHTISPMTGLPVRHSLLSATVIAGDCMSADAYATTFMVMGLERSKKFIAQRDDLEAIFIYSDQEGNYQVFISEEIKKDLVIVDG